MSFSHYIRSGNKLLRCGYTTGTCAALAAAGAAELLLSGNAPEKLSLLTPKGWQVEVEPVLCRMSENSAVCAVRKDAGDDPDVTDGLLISARVGKRDLGIHIDGGIGIGRVTRPGLDQSVGAAAINSVPRRMIAQAVERVCEQHGYGGGLDILISAPEGAEIAAKTFNPVLGIAGGISILGTSGIVEPMSEQAIVDTTALEIRQAAAMGAKRLILCPGNYGLEYLQRELPRLNALPVVKCSNYIGDAIDAAVLSGFRELLLVGHIGKLVKLAGGIMNTHSHTADCRMELFCAHAALCGASGSLCRELMEQVSCDGCLSLLDEAGLRDAVMRSLTEKKQVYLNRRAGGALRIGALCFSNAFGLLGMTDEARGILEEVEP